MIEPLLLSTEDAGKALGIGRSKMFELIRVGEVETVVLGRRRMVPVAELRGFVDRLRTDPVRPDDVDEDNE